MFILSLHLSLLERRVQIEIGEEDKSFEESRQDEQTLPTMV
jgi:hypothetical protein